MTLVERLRERPKVSICAMATISSAAAVAFYALLLHINARARASLGSSAVSIMFWTAAPYLCAAVVALAMTFRSRTTKFAAVHASMATTAVSIVMLLWRFPHLESWGGDMQGFAVLIDWAIQIVLVPLVFLVAYAATARALRGNEQRPNT